jgi:hypothetical protein
MPCVAFGLGGCIELPATRVMERRIESNSLIADTPIGPPRCLSTSPCSTDRQGFARCGPRLSADLPARGSADRCRGCTVGCSDAEFGGSSIREFRTGFNSWNGNSDERPGVVVRAISSINDLTPQVSSVSDAILARLSHWMPSAW